MKEIFIKSQEIQVFFTKCKSCGMDVKLFNKNDPTEYCPVCDAEQRAKTRDVYIKDVTRALNSGTLQNVNFDLYGDIEEFYMVVDGSTYRFFGYSDDREESILMEKVGD